MAFQCRMVYSHWKRQWVPIRSRQFVLQAAAKYGFMGRYNKRFEFSPFERFQVGDAGISQR